MSMISLISTTLSNKFENLKKKSPGSVADSWGVYRLKSEDGDVNFSTIAATSVTLGKLNSYFFNTNRDIFTKIHPLYSIPLVPAMTDFSIRMIDNYLVKNKADRLALNEVVNLSLKSSMAVSTFVLAFDLPVFGFTNVCGTAIDSLEIPSSLISLPLKFAAVTAITLTSYAVSCVYSADIEHFTGISERVKRAINYITCVENKKPSEESSQGV